MIRGLSRGGRRVLLRSPEWTAPPVRTPGGAWVVDARPSALWPEYGRTRPLLNLLASTGHEIQEHVGPERDRGGSPLVERRVTVIAPSADVTHSLADVRFPTGMTSEPILDGDGRPRGVRIRDHVGGDDDRARVHVEILGHGESSHAVTGSDRVVAMPLPLRAAVRRTSALDADTGRVHRADDAVSAAWGRTAALVKLLDDRGHRIHTGFAAYRTLSPAVVHTAGARVSGSSDWQRVFTDIALPAGMQFGSLDDGSAIVRDFPEPFSPDRPRYAIILERP